jgi:hypothetical protein
MLVMRHAGREKRDYEALRAAVNEYAKKVMQFAHRTEDQ